MEMANFNASVGPAGYERIYINHDVGGFKSSKPNTDFTTLNVVILGLVKQRTMWPRRDDSNARTGAKGALCSSPDAETGLPSPSFPWSDFAQLKKQMAVQKQDEILCDNCPFIQWSKDGPQCQERWFVPFYQVESKVDQYANSFQGPDTTTVRVMEFTQSGIKPLREYFQVLMAKNNNCWDVITRVKTIGQTRNTSRGQPGRKFYAPVFKPDSPIVSSLQFDMKAVGDLRKVRDELFEYALKRSSGAQKSPASGITALGSMGS